MYKFKRIIAFVIAVSITFGTFQYVSYASTFTDTLGHWAESAISALADKGIISGKGDGTFQPNSQITRAEFFTLINNAYQLTEEAEITFSDVPADAWYYNTIRKAKAAGYISGYEDNTIRPNSNITRSEMAVVMAGILGLAGNIGGAERFNDFSLIPQWAGPSVGAVAAIGLVRGDTLGNFSPFNNMTRAEAATVILNVLDYKDRQSSGISTSDYDAVLTITEDYGDALEQTVIDGNVVIDEGGLKVQNLVINGDLIITSNADAKVILENVEVTGKVIILGESVEMSGTYNEVELDAKTNLVVAAYKGSSTISTLTINKTAEGSSIRFATGTSVSLANINAKVSLTGTGKINLADISVAGVTAVSGLIQAYETNSRRASIPTSTSGGRGSSTTPGGTPTIQATGIKLNMDDTTLEVCEEIELEATLEPSTATKAVVWRTSDPDIVTFDANSNTAKIIGVNVGEAIISAEDGDGNHVAICEVTVTHAIITSTTTDFKSPYTGDVKIIVDGVVSITDVEFQGDVIIENAPPNSPGGTSIQPRGLAVPFGVGSVATAFGLSGGVPFASPSVEFKTGVNAKSNVIINAAVPVNTTSGSTVHTMNVMRSGAELNIGGKLSDRINVNGGVVLNKITSNSDNPINLSGGGRVNNVDIEQGSFLANANVDNINVNGDITNLNIGGNNTNTKVKFNSSSINAAQLIISGTATPNINLNGGTINSLLAVSASATGVSSVTGNGTIGKLETFGEGSANGFISVADTISKTPQTITEPELIGIEVVSRPNKTTYFDTDTELNTGGLVVFATYAVGAIEFERETKAYDVGTIDFSTVGTHTVTVTSKEKDESGGFPKNSFVITVTGNKTNLIEAISKANNAKIGVIVAASNSEVAQGKPWVTASIVNTLNKAILVAEAIRRGSSTTTAEAEAAKVILETATKTFIDAIKYDGTMGSVNKKDLADAITKAKAEVKVPAISTDGKDIPHQGKWTTLERITNYREAITAAELVFTTTTTQSQTEVDAATASLNVLNLNVRTAIVNYSGLNSSITNAEVQESKIGTGKDEINKVTSGNTASLDESVKWVHDHEADALTRAIDVAQNVLVKTNPNASQKQVDEAAAALNNATNAFISQIKTKGGITTILDNLISIAANLLKDVKDQSPGSDLKSGDKYLPTVYSAKRTDLANAIKVASDASASADSSGLKQEKINELAADLSAAIDTFNGFVKVVPIKTALQATVNSAEEALAGAQSSTDGNGIYTNEFWVPTSVYTALENAISSAKGILRMSVDQMINATPDAIEQKHFDDAVDTLNDAIASFNANRTQGTTPLPSDIKYVTSVELNKDTLDLVVGDKSETLIATIKPSEATVKTVTWSSSDTSVATVANGVVTPVGRGTATITVTTVGVDASGNTVSDDCEVTVKEDLTGTVVLTLNRSTGEVTASVKGTNSDTSKLVYAWSGGDNATGDGTTLNAITHLGKELVLTVTSSDDTITTGSSIIGRITVYEVTFTNETGNTVIMQSSQQYGIVGNPVVIAYERTDVSYVLTFEVPSTTGTGSTVVGSIVSSTSLTGDFTYNIAAGHATGGTIALKAKLVPSAIKTFITSNLPKVNEALSWGTTKNFASLTNTKWDPDNDSANYAEFDIKINDDKVYAIAVAKAVQEVITLIGKYDNIKGYVIHSGKDDYDNYSLYSQSSFDNTKPNNVGNVSLAVANVLKLDSGFLGLLTSDYNLYNNSLKNQTEEQQKYQKTLAEFINAMKADGATNVVYVTAFDTHYDKCSDYKDTEIVCQFKFTFVDGAKTRESSEFDVEFFTANEDSYNNEGDMASDVDVSVENEDTEGTDETVEVTENSETDETKE